MMGRTANDELFKRSRAGLYDTVWPLEHADRWRTQTAPDGGLPAGFDPAALRLDVEELDQPMVGYTRERREVFVLGGMPFLMNQYTQAILRDTTEAPQAGLEQLLADREHVPYVAKID